jgi:hypothetical protein
MLQLFVKSQLLKARISVRGISLFSREGNDFRGERPASPITTIHSLILGRFLKATESKQSLTVNGNDPQGGRFLASLWSLLFHD